MNAEELNPSNPRHYPVAVLEKSIREVQSVLAEAEQAVERSIARRDKLKARKEGLQWAIDAIVEADGATTSGVEYSPADGQQEVREAPRSRVPRFRVGQRVEVAVADTRGWVPVGTVGVIEEVDPASSVKAGKWYSVRFPEHGTLTLAADRLALWEPPRNSAGVPLIVGNHYTLHRPDNSAQHNRMVKLREEVTTPPGQWHVEFVDTHTDGIAAPDELK